MRLTLWLTGLAGSNAALGFLYHWYLLTTLGPGRETDAFFAGLMIPQLVLAVLGGSLASVLVPMLSTEDPDGRGRLVWTTLYSVVLIGVALSLALGLTAPLWVPLTVPGFGADAVRLTTELFRIQLPAVVLSLVSTVQRAASNARGRFVWVEASATLTVLSGFGFLAVTLPSLGVAAAAWAMVLRSALQVALLLRSLGPIRPPVWRLSALNRLWHRLQPLLLGSLYYKSDIVVDRMLASLVPSGLLSLYYLGHQLWSSAYLVLSKAIAAPAVPRLARYAEQKDWNRFRWLNRSRLTVLLLIAAATYAGLLAFGRPVLNLLFEGGRFTPEQVRQLWWLLVALGGLWIGGAAGQIVATSFYAQGETRLLTRIGAFWFTVGIGLKLVGFYFFGIWGVAIGTSLSYLASAAAQQLTLERRYHLKVATGSHTPGSVRT
ncbi:MAG: lipid II flippase MurJ [Gemmatimonadales bacterium]